MAFFIGNLVGEAVIKRITIEDVNFICGSLSAASFQVRRQGDAGVPTIGKVESNRMQFCDSKDSSSQPETKRYLKKTMNSACTDASQII